VKKGFQRNHSSLTIFLTENKSPVWDFVIYNLKLNVLKILNWTK